MNNARFEQLCAELDGRIEDRSFDMKRELPSVRDLVKHIQGGLNGVEPSFRIIIGVDEGPRKSFERRNVKPIVWSASEGAHSDPDAYRLAIDDSLRSSTSDFHEGLWSFEVVSAPGGDVLVLEAIQSPYRPHQNTRTNQYYIRRSGSTSAMTSAELRQAFTQDLHDRWDPEEPRTQLESEAFLADLRHHKWVPGADELRFSGGPQFHLRLSPINLTVNRHSVVKLRASSGRLHALGPWTSGSHERVEDGFIAWRVERNNAEVTGSFSKVFTTGEIWGVDNTMVSPRGGDAANIPAVIIEKTRQKLMDYAAVLETLGELPPYRVQFALHGVRGASLHTSSRGNDGHLLQDVFVFNAIWDRSQDDDAVALVKAIARELWDACGLAYVG